MLLLLIVLITLAGIALCPVVPRAKHHVQRRRETELRLILGEFNRAVSRFIAANDRPPVSIDELLLDPSGRKFLRRIYPDPTSGRSDWILASNRQGEPTVFSANQRCGISGIPYSDWGK